MIRPISNRQPSPDCRIHPTPKSGDLSNRTSGQWSRRHTIASPSSDYRQTHPAALFSLVCRTSDRVSGSLSCPNEEAFSLLDEFSLHVTTAKRNLILETFLGDRFRQQRGRCVARSGKKNKRGKLRPWNILPILF
ncbi:hypothetical protein CDAR_78671 [Caerostris darwini]|uniref:Uncharacterized protein n=1 Tax=Caerostris darwini TaxID=1538125 RepID=A0AAV4QU61_9ARAC|nr:hypothetical protein CDAR_78671 [Caerostris darwini]